MEDYRKKPAVLRFNPTKMSREYGSNIYITKAGRTDRIQFRTSVIYAGLFMDTYPIFHLYKQDVYINKTVPDQHSYRLAEACNKILYPIVVFCDKEGQIVGLRNDLIRQRWLDQKITLEREFSGEFVQRYITQTEKNLNDSKKVLDLIYKNMFFYNFFRLKYGYVFDFNPEVNEVMSFFAFNPSLETKGIQKSSLEEDAIIVTQTGRIIDDREFNYNGLLSTFTDEGIGKVTGNYNIRYELDIELRCIDSMIYQVDLKKDNQEDLLSIKMESYYLREYPLENIEDTDTIALGNRILKQEEKLERKNRKPFWQRFKDYLNEPL